MRAGILRHRVRIQKTFEAQATDGQSVESWSDWAKNVPAEVRELRGRTYLEAQAEHTGVTTQITMRKQRDDLTPRTYRIVHGRRVYHIIHSSPSVRGNELRILCELAGEEVP